MNIPKELIKKWYLESTKDGDYLAHIAQRAAEWALSQPVSMEPAIYITNADDASALPLAAYNATQLAAARQQGADEQKQKSSDAYESFNKRIAELEKSNAQLLEALKELAAEEWRDDDDQILDRARIKARAAIVAAEVKP